MKQPLAGLLLVAAALGTSALAADSWRLVRQDVARSIQVYTAADNALPYDRCYAVTRMTAPLDRVLAQLVDINSAPAWVARLQAVHLLRRQANQDWVYAQYHMPYPLHPRDMVLHTVITRGEKGAVEVESTTVIGMVPPRSDMIRVNNAHTHWRLTPLPAGGVQVEFWGEGSPGGYVPPWLYNYNLPFGPEQTLRNLRRLVLAPPPAPVPHARRGG